MFQTSDWSCYHYSQHSIWSSSSPGLDPRAPEFRLKTSNLLTMEDCLGLVDYTELSCTGNPMGEIHEEIHKITMPMLSPMEDKKPELHTSSSTSSEGNSESSQEWLEIPVKELLASKPRCGWSRKKTKICKRYCEHSFCARDDLCPFIHAKPMLVHRDQIVFLGGLPKDCTRASLFKELIDSGFPVINYPIVLDRFTPRVVMKSKICTDDLRRALAAESCQLVNVPTINRGYVINCEVANKGQQEKLISKGFIDVLGQRTQVKRLTKRKRSPVRF